jgi:monoterpene epsilon-lactone hydrolase
LIEYVGYLIPLASDIRSETVNISLGGTTVSGTWFVPPLIEDKDRVVLYFHGGGYVSGSVFSHSGLTGELARRIRGRVLSVEYRLAPESPHSAAIEDALLSYRWLIHEQNIPPNKIVIAGDSAGGGLTLLTLLEIPFAEKGTLPRPAAGVTFSAVTDWGDYRPSYTRNRDKDVVVHIDVKHRAMVTATAADDVARRKSPKLSPIYAPLDQIAKLPPLFMSVGTAEVLEDDTVHFAGKAKQAAVDLTLKVYENAQHVTVYFFDYVPEANTALNDVAQFIIKKTTHT